MASIALALALVCGSSAVPSVALSAPAHQEEPTPVAPPDPGQEQTEVAPTPTPTATAVPLGTPVTGLVLVPLAVRAAAPPPDMPPDLALVRGRVVNAAGQGLHSQVVKIARQGFAVTAITGGDGGYEVGGLAPGTYTVTVERHITTPVEGLRIQAGGAVQVDFGQIRTVTVTPSPGRSPTPGPTLTPTVTATPRPPTATATVVVRTTPTPRPTPSSNLVGQVWSSLGIEIDADNLLSSLIMGVIGGVFLGILGLVIALARR